LVFETKRENNKRLETGKGDYMNFTTFICLETITMILTVVAVTAIALYRPPR
jgi:hypothetical protein